MKKHLIIAGIICAVTIPPAAAVTKCVKLTSSATCINPSAELRQSNWSATCGGIEIQGIGLCGSKNGLGPGIPSGSVTTSSTPDDNIYCWCKMVSPAVSHWVFYDADTPASNCASICARYCAYDALRSSVFRTALFSGLSD